MTETIHLDPWFQGPTGSGQGGWTAHRLARTMTVPAEVSIRRPVPIATDLVIEGDGTARRLLAPDGTVIAEAVERTEVIPGTDPVTVDAARDARTRFPFAPADHPVPHCFSCGTGADAMGVHAGPLGDGRWATDWTVPDWAVTDRAVDPGVLWTALDCSAAWFACCEGGVRVAFTVAYTVAQDEPLRAGATYALVSWGDEWDGRKRRAGSAAFDADGACVARSASLWVAPAD